MLFHTPEFIFLFLPLALALHFALARWSVNAAIAGTTIFSLMFYAWWNPPFVLLPVLSIAGNFWLARLMIAAQRARARQLVIGGIIANLLVLCYFKYTGFLLSIFDGRPIGVPNVPLALSFTTFVQIAFLVYVYQRRPAVAFSRYALFVAFFPHLIAGPIVRWDRLGRQLNDSSLYHVDWNNVALGLTIFTLGLAKKVLIASSLAPHVALVFDAAARSEPLTAIAAWGGAVAFSLQLLFDFSAYSEMAVGLGLLFNYRLPINFAAPLRATNLFDLWRRWHVTLSRFLSEFIYMPLRRGHPGAWWGALCLVSTLVVSGLWHGANWTFIIWGAIHGVGLLLNVVWRKLVGSDRFGVFGSVTGWFVTFTIFAAAIVFFRAADVTAAWWIVRAMAGLGNAPIAESYLAVDGWFVGSGLTSDVLLRTWFGAAWSIRASLWTLGVLALMLIVPDTMEIVGYDEDDARSNWRRPAGILTWRPSLPAFGVIAILFALVFASIGRVSEFLYYRF